MEIYEYYNGKGDLRYIMCHEGNGNDRVTKEDFVTKIFSILRRKPHNVRREFWRFKSVKTDTGFTKGFFADHHSHPDSVPVLVGYF